MNEGYNGMASPSYGMPQHQQMQYFVYFVNSREEAERWPVGPGNVLIFRQMDGSFVYIKSLGFSPYDKPVFEVFPKAIEQTSSPVPAVDEEYKKLAEANAKAIEDLTSQITALQEEISKNRAPKYENRNKGGRN